VAERFGWTDYELTGPLTLSLGDYTFHAFGCNQTIDYLMSSMKKIRQRNESVRWMLIEFWGRGKSTLMYNFCHEVNKRLFFSSDHSPTLALYVNYPQRAEDLLDYSYENGLAIPWTPGKRRDEVQNARRDLFAKALRMLAYAWIRKACCDKDFTGSATSVQLPRVIDRKNLVNNNLMKIVEYIDSLTTQGKYDALAELLSSFFAYSFRHKNFDNEELIFPQIMEFFPGLLYPESTGTFLMSFSKLFGEPGKGLRNFLVFQRVCELVNVHVLVVIDETEDWDYMARTRLDEFLIEIFPTNRLSVVLILRTEVENRLRGIQKRLRYFLVRSYMKRIRLRDPNPPEILEIARGVLSTCRTDGCLKLFPFTEDFILALSNLTVRGGHFNSRMFLRSLDRILKLSLTWERNTTEITVDFVKRPDLLDAVVENFRIEDKKELESSVLAKAEEIQNKMEAARDIAERLLTGKVDPPTRYIFEIVKEIVSEQHQVPILSDIEIIAYSKKEHRAKVARLIRELKEAPQSGSQLP